MQSRRKEVGFYLTERDRFVLMMPRLSSDDVREINPSKFRTKGERSVSLEGRSKKKNQNTNFSFPPRLWTQTKELNKDKKKHAEKCTNLTKS